MKRQRLLTVTMGALVLGGLLEAGYGSADVKADAQGVPSELPGATQNRNKDLPAAQRFVILPTFTNDAVLDKATGLVWERSPQTTSARWSEGRRICIEKHVGGHKGWRLPSLEELSGLVDFSVAPPGLALPPGHPFLGIRSAVYWSSTRPGEDPKGAWGVHFGLGGGATFINWAHMVQVWCVRDGMEAGQP
ncbi:MAG TPA: DUF1566 domain-containing protein [Nitrospiraceae bacterium]|nr:DUF1566 domain-containing protein [Nitrospiraceae bacterium]